MTFGLWVKQLLGFGTATNGSAAESAAALEQVGASAEDEVQGLNFRSAIEAHQKWKGRLQAVLDGVGETDLCVDTVRCDHHCLLGKWIHGPGGARFGHHEAFQQLKQEHAAFHRLAGQVLQLHRAGDEIAAQRLYRQDYLQISQNVVLQLARMYAATANGTRQTA